MNYYISISLIFTILLLGYLSRETDKIEKLTNREEGTLNLFYKNEVVQLGKIDVYKLVKNLEDKLKEDETGDYETTSQNNIFTDDREKTLFGKQSPLKVVSSSIQENLIV